MAKAKEYGGAEHSFWKNMVRHRAHIVLALPAFLVMLFILYVPMVGLIIAFKNYTYSGGIFGSEWVGFKNFEFLIASKNLFVTMTRNTVLYYLLFRLGEYSIIHNTF